MTPTQLYANPEDLKANPWNTNQMSPENEAKLDTAIRRMGMFKPIVVRETDDGFQILGGEHRRDAAIRLGIKEVPVISVGRIDDVRAKEISLADNARYGSDDIMGLAHLLDGLGVSQDDLESFLPYTDTDLDSIMSSVNIDVDALDYDESEAPSDTSPTDTSEKTAKTHVVMRFKVAIGDSERVSKLIQSIQTEQGFTEADALTNAGDALVHALLGASDDA
ncbi:chromosome partitioning protein ParB [Roseospira marina]|uniref:Chromosome partitioning protein ParB n=1 Tax=Roseospira marina TaxID=140057 RepID=A0A5M6I9L2_9PROT|nr:ParB/RepB/Spo0J family partition protein [Roseospira marina]KAA5604415.1 chromosome partitioning protein ParB [Roseospira marina]MBB4315390.1 hypothetical protein [Roseospira marina]MBB5088465.1 hypothetical protein [Roseospira marina]